MPKRINTADDEDYPINIGFIMESSEEKFIGYFFNGLQGPEGERAYLQKNGVVLPVPYQKQQGGCQYFRFMKCVGPE